MKKLKKRLKSEKSGAMRELRKDNYFLSAVKEKERIKQEQERAEKYGKAMAFLQEQESAFKSGQLGKGKGRKRGGDTFFMFSSLAGVNIRVMLPLQLSLCILLLYWRQRELLCLT